MSLAFLASPAKAAPAVGDEAFVRAAGEAVDRIAREDGFSGVILVARGDRVLLRRAAGLADRERNIPNTPETRFPLASVTKQFTAAAIMLLVEDGKISLADPISKYFAAGPPELCKRYNRQNFEQTDCWKRESSSVTKHLQSGRSAEACGRVGRRRKGWSPERRALQAAVIRRSKPWQRSTGPKTKAGKTRCAMNALKHGFRSRATIRRFRRVSHALRLAAKNNEMLRDYIRSARPRIKYKAWYERRVGGFQRTMPPSVRRDFLRAASFARLF